MRIEMSIKNFVRSAVTMGVVVASSGVVAPMASAATANDNMQVTASVLRNCQITSTAAIAFGDYDVQSTTDVSKQGRVTVACTKGVNATIGLGAGLNGNRTMNGPSTDKLTYQLFQNVNSGEWTNSAVVSHNATSRTSKDFTVYGRLAAGQDVTAGSYTDTVVATINF
jgi:spore coat protein U-like protein